MMLNLQHKNISAGSWFLPRIYRTIIVVLFCFFSFDSLAQTPNWVWAKRTGGISSDWAISVAADAFGNSYVAGHYYSAPITFGSVTLLNAGLSDVFLIKYDASGNVVWARRAGNSGSEWAQAVTTDAAGNVYITGGFNSAPLVFGSTLLTPAGHYDFFIAKYDSAGNVIWATSAGSTEPDLGTAIAVTAAGDIYVGGNFYSSSITFGASTLINLGMNDGFIAKYNSAGTALWGVRIGDYSEEYVHAITTDATGNVYVTGPFNSIFVTVGNVTLTNAMDAMDDIYLIKFDGSGNVIWARTAGGWDNDYPYGIARDAAGNIYLTGWFGSNPMSFGSITLSNMQGSLYLAKYNSAGTIQWIAAPGYGIGRSVTVDACGDIYWTGYFGFNVPITFGSTTLTSSGVGDIFVAKYNSSGAALWAMKAGGSLQETATSIAVSPLNNRLVIAGDYNSPSVLFGPTTLNNAGADGFVAQLSPTCLIAPLPVELVAFSGKEEGAVNVLQWETASEINNDFFSVERSSTGTDFESIGTVRGMGNTTVLSNYSFVDNAPLPMSYYRLKQTDFDGTGTHSDVIAIQREINTVAVFPNPVYDEVLVYAPWMEFTAEISDVQGREIVSVKSDKKDIVIPVNELIDGVYFLSLQNGEEKIVKRLIKTSAKN